MSRLLPRFFKRLTISACLRGAFLTGALLTLTVSGVSLYSWHEQSSQVRYALDDYFPRIQSSFVIESNLNTLVDQLNEFLQAANTNARLQLRNQIVDHLEQIEQASMQLDNPERQQIQATLAESRQLLGRLDNALYNMFIAREKVNEIAARISWLHDDFTTELNSLVQDFSWQQGALLDQMETGSGQALPRLQASLREVQSEQQQVYALARIENQIADALRDRLNELQSGAEEPTSVAEHVRYLAYLKKTANDNMQGLQAHPSTITLRQTIDELLETGIAENSMPAAMKDYHQAQRALTLATQAKEATLARFRTQLESQLSNSHQQMQTFNHRLEQIIRVSGRLIVIATLLAMLLVYLLNHYFIRSRLVKRFTLLNQVVVRIGLGETNAAIPVYGGDELGRIARLLRRTLGQLNQQKSRLEQEITERKGIEQHLRATQDELVQAAKLAVVGQTMTTLAHEINQPLNALSMYLFTARHAVEKQQPEAATLALTKADGLIGRMDAIIRMLRQFTRRTEQDSPSQPVDLRQSLIAAWELLALRHQPLRGELRLPDGAPNVLGDEVRIQQVLVNLMSNALDACQERPLLQISWQRQASGWQVLLWDNGPGWPLARAESLLKPFTTSKSVGLGIGLSISLSLMQQMGGSLHLASTLTQNACVVLQFQPVDQPC
ncbi:HAMP domain-containing protein [Serratia sp. JSRIV001]|uniref:two-component system sensor histidine kinase PgtB n=1 Tax=Serratia sp. JSRIV001 TaxID=2831893 RepID=UPI001CBDFECD|nr:ATP-binding protein [Serratia sp. JSRIV001]UAN44549.1 HAMP domain-containing protein [Serratia sp. JSRIV001]